MKFISRPGDEEEIHLGEEGEQAVEVVVVEVEEAHEERELFQVWGNGSLGQRMSQKGKCVQLVWDSWSHREDMLQQGEWHSQRRKNRW